MQARIKRLSFATAAIGLVLTLALASVLFARMNSIAVLYVDPPVIEDPSILPNSTITVQVKMTPVSGLKTCRFNMTFSPEVLSVQSISQQKVQEQYPQMVMDVDDALGYMWLSLTYKTPVTIAADTALVEIVFNVLNYGTTPLHFESSQFADGAGGAIDHETADGFVHIIRRNVAVLDVTCPYAETYVGRVIPVNVTVLNDGDISENFAVTLRCDSTVLATADVVNLASKENLTLTFNWDTGTVPPRMQPYLLSAEASTVPNEAETLDNVFVDGTVKLKLVGDINGDGTVNIDDLTAWDAAYGSHVGEPNWDVQADINYDGLVDKADATLILDHYRETL